MGLGVQLGIDVPADVQILTIEAQDVTNFGEYLTPAVASAVPKAAAMILQQLNNIKREALTSSQASGKLT
jgi:Ni,Fe-hydrogenase maturation factor